MLTKQQVEFIFNELKTKPLSQVAKDFNLSIYSIRQGLYKYDFADFNLENRFNFEEIKPIVDKYGRGAACKKIKGFPDYLFYIYCDKHKLGKNKPQHNGINSRLLSKSEKSLERDLLIKESILNGEKYKDIASKFQVSTKHVTRVASAFGVQRVKRVDIISDEDYDNEMLRLINEFGCIEQRLIVSSSKFSLSGVLQHYGSMVAIKERFNLSKDVIGEQELFLRYFERLTNISLLREYKLSYIDSTLNKHYRFDGFNEDLRLAVEYDDISHFKPIPRFGGVEGLNIRKQRDSFKNEFCVINNIRLIRFNYLTAFTHDIRLKIEDIVHTLQ